MLGIQTPSGEGYRRYGTLLESVNGTNEPVTGGTDGYGDCYAPAPMHCPITGRPWIPWFTGTGHVWPLLNGERGEQDLQTSDDGGASQMLLDMANFAAGVGMIPEQDWVEADVPPSPYGSDPTTASIGFTNGKPAGSAGEITWVEAGFVRLAQDIKSGRLLEQPAVVRDRYPGPRRPTRRTAHGDRDAGRRSGHGVGTTAPDASLVVAATLSPTGRQPIRAAPLTISRSNGDPPGDRRPDGSFSVRCPPRRAPSGLSGRLAGRRDRPCPGDRRRDRLGRVPAGDGWPGSPRPGQSAAPPPVPPAGRR